MYDILVKYYPFCRIFFNYSIITRYKAKKDDLYRYGIRNSPINISINSLRQAQYNAMQRIGLTTTLSASRLRRDQIHSY